MRDIYKFIIASVLFVGLFSGLFFGALHITSQFNNKEESIKYVTYNGTIESIIDILPYTTPNNIDQPLNTSSSTRPIDHLSTLTIYETSTPPVILTSTPPVILTSTPLIIQTSTPLITETSKSPETETSTPSVTKTSKLPATETSTLPVTQKLTPPVIQTSTPPFTQTSTPPFTQTSTPPFTQTSKSPATETSTPPVTETSTPPVTETSTPPVTQISTPPFTQTSKSPVTQTLRQTARSVSLGVKLNEQDEYDFSEVNSDEIEIYIPKIGIPYPCKKGKYLDKADEKSTCSDICCPNYISKNLSKLGYNIEDVIILHNDSNLTILASPRNVINNINKYCQSMKPKINKLIENISSNLKQSNNTTETAKLINVYDTILDFIKEYTCLWLTFDERKFRDKQIDKIKTNGYTKMVLNIRYKTMVITTDYIFSENYRLFFKFY